jgi:hypothetical protein
MPSARTASRRVSPAQLGPRMSGLWQQRRRQVVRAAGMPKGQDGSGPIVCCSKFYEPDRTVMNYESRTFTVREVIKPSVASARRRLDRFKKDHLLAGEPDDTRDIADAAHWVKMYADLLAFKRDLLALTHRSLAAMSSATRTEVMETGLIATKLTSAALNGAWRCGNKLEQETVYARTPAAQQARRRPRRHGSGLIRRTEPGWFAGLCRCSRPRSSPADELMSSQRLNSRVADPAIVRTMCPPTYTPICCHVYRGLACWYE